MHEVDLRSSATVPPFRMLNSSLVSLLLPNFRALIQLAAEHRLAAFTSVTNLSIKNREFRHGLPVV
jgi:hypothetical protein